MATSGSYDYSATANSVITEALELIGVYAAGETLEVEDTTSVLRTLNFMLKAWRNVGLWTKKEYTLFLQDETFSYGIGPTGDHCAISAVKTELAAAAAAAATSVTIDATTDFGDTFDRNGILESTTPTAGGTLELDGDLTIDYIATLSSQRKILIYSDGDDSGVTFGITGETASGVVVTETITGPNTTTVYSVNTYKKVNTITISAAGTGNIEIGQVGDHVGIELDGGTVQWTHIAAALSTTLTLAAALTGAAAVDNHVYSYTTQAQRPLEIDEVRLRLSNGNERPLADPVSRAEYMTLSNKDSPGSPNQIYFDPQRTNAIIRTWPTCNNVQEYIKFTGKYPIQDVDDLTDDFDLPSEWFEALAWNVAIRSGPKFGRPIDPAMVSMAGDMKRNVMMFDREMTSSFLEVVP